MDKKPTPKVADIVSAERITWRKLDNETIRAVRTEAANAGDEELVGRADRALARRTRHT